MEGVVVGASRGHPSETCCWRPGHNLCLPPRSPSLPPGGITLARWLPGITLTYSTLLTSISSSFISSSLHSLHSPHLPHSNTKQQYGIGNGIDTLSLWNSYPCRRFLVGNDFDNCSSDAMLFRTRAGPVGTRRMQNNCTARHSDGHRTARQDNTRLVDAPQPAGGEFQNVL